MKSSLVLSLRPSRSAPRASRHAGFTLIEVLIALIVLVLGVLGAAGMTLASMRDSKQSGLRGQASAFAYQLSDIMRANPPIYSIAVAPSTPVLLVDTEAIFRAAPPSGGVAACWSSGCTPTEMATNDYYEWSQKLSGPGGLPNGTAVVCHDKSLTTMACDNDPTAPLVVKIQWDEKNNTARDQTSGAAAVTVRMMSVVIKPTV